MSTYLLVYRASHFTSESMQKGRNAVPKLNQTGRNVYVMLTTSLLNLACDNVSQILSLLSDLSTDNNVQVMYLFYS